MLIHKYFNRQYYTLDRSSGLTLQQAALAVLDGAVVKEFETHKDITREVLIKYVQNADSLTDIELRLHQVKTYLNT